MQCYTKAADDAGCRRSCRNGSAYDADGIPWSCVEVSSRWPAETRKQYSRRRRKSVPLSTMLLGRRRTRRGGPAIQSAPHGGPTLGTCLFCFMVAMPSTGESWGEKPQEDALMGTQMQQQRGIFACDASKVYWRGPGSGPRGSIEFFAEVWGRVHQDGVNSSYDWAVKVDPDTVFFPDRLRQHLGKMRVPTRQPLYLQNGNSKFGVDGALELLSTGALQVFLAGYRNCSGQLQGVSNTQEFFRRCLDSLGIGHMKDTNLLNDKYLWGKPFDGQEVDFCNSSVHVGFHPLKTVSLWNDCWAKAQAAEDNQAMAMAQAAAQAQAELLGYQLQQKLLHRM